MAPSTEKTTQQLLDAVQRLVQLEELDAVGFQRRLAEELEPSEPTLPVLEANDARLRAALAAIDGFASRALRIRLDHLLADDTSVATPFRKVLASTVVSYEGRLDLLHERVASAAARVDPGRAADTATRVVAAAESVLALRAELRGGVLALARDLAAGSLPAVRERSRDRSAEDAVRARWVLARRDLELVVEQPARVAELAFADRLKALPPMDEPVEAVREYTRGELLELD